MLYGTHFMLGAGYTLYKGGHIRTVPVPAWVKATVDAWTTAACLVRGRIFRAINKAGRIWGDGMTPKVV